MTTLKSKLEINPQAMMTTDMFQWIGDNLNPKNGPILEFGSGYGTHVLVDLGFTVVSVEEDKYWCDKYHDNYVYAPLDKRTGWYDVEKLKEAFTPHKHTADEQGWSCVIIDGPTSDRSGILPHLDYFGIGKSAVVVDDVGRTENQTLLDTLRSKIIQTRQAHVNSKEWAEANKAYIKRYMEGAEGYVRSSVWQSNEAAIII